MADDAAPVEAAWVVQGEPRELRRSVRAIRRIGVDRVISLGERAACAELTVPVADSAMLDRIRRRVERRTGPIEARLDCDVARYPLGRGFVMVLVGQPADGIEAALDAHGPAYREVVRPLDPADPVRICLPGLAVGDPLLVVSSLRDDGFLVLGAYAVGGCRR